MKKKNNIKINVEEAKKDVTASSTVEASKELAKALNKQEQRKNKRNKKSKSSTKKSKRDVKAYAIVDTDKQSNYEQRFYMRNFHKNEKAKVVRHKSSHSIEQCKVQCLAFMRECAKSSTKKTIFTTSDLIRAVATFGPSYGDVVRNAMRKLAKEQIVRIHKVADNERTRAKYKFELVKLE